MKLPAAISAFLEHAQNEAGLSPATLSAYSRDLEQLKRWCRDSGIDQVGQLQPSDVRSFAASEHRRGLTPTSIQRRLSGLRRFFRYLRREKILHHDPAEGVRAPRARRRLPNALDVDQVAALLDIPEDNDLARRDRAMLELLYSAGLRVSELATLTWNQVDLTEGMVRVVGKGRRERIVPIGAPAIKALRRWHKIHFVVAGSDQPQIFTSMKGKPLGVRAIQKRVAWWSTRQGLDQTVHPHQLRHSFASHILESSGDLRAVQELLGHANLSTTQIYTHLDFQHLAETYDRTHPRAKNRD